MECRVPLNVFLMARVFGLMSDTMGRMYIGMDLEFFSHTTFDVGSRRLDEKYTCMDWCLDNVFLEHLVT